MPMQGVADDGFIPDSGDGFVADGFVPDKPPTSSLPISLPNNSLTRTKRPVSALDMQEAARVNPPGPAPVSRGKVPLLEDTLADTEKVLSQPISKTLGGSSLNELVDHFLPEKTPEASGGAIPTWSQIYDQFRRAAKVGAGIGDFMSTPEGLALAGVEGASGGTATPLVASLVATQFTVDGSQQALDAYKDIRKNGLTPENSEKFLMGMAVASGGVGAAVHGAQVPPAFTPVDLNLKATKNKNASEADIDSEVKQVLSIKRLNRDQRRATVEVPETGEFQYSTEVPEGDPWGIARKEAQNKLDAEQFKRLQYEDALERSQQQKTPLQREVEQEPIHEPLDLEEFKPSAQEEPEESLSTLLPEEDTPIEQTAPRPTLSDLYSDLGEIRKHPAHVNPNEASGDSIANFLDDLWAAGEKHKIPEVFDIIKKASDALESDDPALAMKLAEEARGKLRAEYGRRLAKSEAERLGITLPEETDRPLTQYDILRDNAAMMRMHNWATDAEFISSNQIKKGHLGVSDEDFAALNDEGVQDLESRIKERERPGRSYGIKEEGPLKHFKQSPIELARAIRKGSGKLFNEIRDAFRQAVDDHEGDSIREFLSKSDEHKGSLFGDDFLTFEKGDTEPTLGGTEEEQMTRLAAGRKTEQLKEGKVFDENALVNSELFGGKGGRQMELPTEEPEYYGVEYGTRSMGMDHEEFPTLQEALDFAREQEDSGEHDFVSVTDSNGKEYDHTTATTGDTSFNFGDNALKFLDEASEKTKADIQAKFKSIARGETLGANLPIELLGDLVKYGAIKIARSGVKFAQWSKEMVDEFGEIVRPHLQTIWNSATQRASELRNFKPDEYFNFKRVNLSDAEKAALQSEILNTIITTGRIPKEVESHAEIVRQAKELGIDPQKYLESFQKSQPQYRAVRMAARQRINALSAELAKMRENYAGTEDLGKVKELDQKEADLQGLLDVWMRMRSEDGRNLAMHRIIADSTWEPTYWLSRAKRAMGIPEGVSLPTEVQDTIQKILNEGVDAEKELETAQQQSKSQGQVPRPQQGQTTPTATQTPQQPNLPGIPTTPRIRAARNRVNAARQQMAQTITQLQKTGLLQTIISLRAAGLLTGLKTHLRNVGGNASFQLLEELSRIPSAIVDMGLKLGTGKRTVQGASVDAMFKSAKEAATQGISDAKNMMATGAYVDPAGKVRQSSTMNSGVPFLDNYANFISRTMSAEDAVFKSSAFRRSLEEQMKLSGTTIPTQAMVIQAIADSEFATFNNPNIAAKGIGVMQGYVSKKGGAAGKTLSAAIDFAVPFKNTPANIIARLFDYTPINIGLKGGYHTYRAFVDGALSPAQQRAISQAIGRGMTGTALMLMGYQLAKKGLMTGTNETDSAQRNVSQAAGRLPGSILIGGRWHQVAPFSPLGNVLTLGATILREQTRPLRNEALRFWNMAAIATRTALEQPMLKGTSDVIEALQDPAAQGERVAGAMAGSFVPTAISDVASVFDPYMRDTRNEGILASAKMRLPGVRNTLPPRVDVLGRTMEQSKLGAVDPTIGSIAKELSDPVIKAIQENKIGVGYPQRKPNESDEAFRLRAELRGKLIDERVGITVNSPGYARMKPEQQKKLIESAISNAGDVAGSLSRRTFKNPADLEKYLQSQIDRVQARLSRRK